MPVSALVSLALGVSLQAAPNTLTPAEKKAGFELLFDGRTLNGWKGWRRHASANGWVIEDACLAFVPGRERGDICTVDEFGDFELRIAWKVEPGGNSGIFYRADETKTPVWATGMEFQVLDDHRHRDGRDPITSAGSLYSMYAPSVRVSRAAGEWNDAKIVAKGPKVEHWLNGIRVAAFTIGSEDWEKRAAASKFKPSPTYGKSPTGRIVLQDHGNRVWYRSIRIRRM